MTQLHVNHLNIDPNTRDVLVAITEDLEDLRDKVNALTAQLNGDVTVAACVETAEAVVANLAALFAAHNAAAEQLNASDDATDEDYATDLAMTAANPTAQTAAALVVTATAAEADIEAFATAFNALSTKLNADELIDDEDYEDGLGPLSATAPASSGVDDIAASLASIIEDLDAFRTAFNARQEKIAADAAGSYPALDPITAAAPAVAVEALDPLRMSVT